MGAPVFGFLHPLGAGTVWIGSGKAQGFVHFGPLGDVLCHGDFGDGFPAEPSSAHYPAMPQQSRIMGYLYATERGVDFSLALFILLILLILSRYPCR